MKLCDPKVKEYWVCRQEHGLLVVLRCRDQYNAMHECVTHETRDDSAYQVFRAEKMRVIEENRDKPHVRTQEKPPARE